MCQNRHRPVIDLFHAGNTFEDSLMYFMRNFKLIIFPFIYRYNNSWETNFSLLQRSNENSSQSKKQRECGESARDSLAYSCLLKNELLGASIDDIKSVSDDSKASGYLQNSNRGLFRYQPNLKKVIKSSDFASLTIS